MLIKFAALDYQLHSVNSLLEIIRCALPAFFFEGEPFKKDELCRKTKLRGIELLGSGILFQILQQARNQAGFCHQHWLCVNIQ